MSNWKHKNVVFYDNEPAWEGITDVVAMKQRQ